MSFDLYRYYNENEMLCTGWLYDQQKSMWSVGEVNNKATHGNELAKEQNFA